MTDQTAQPGIIVDRIALKKVQFELAGEASVETGVAARHEIALGILADASAGSYHITAGLRTPAEHPGPYRFEIVMEAIVREDPAARNMSAEHYARQYGWALLFPFIRERLADLTSRAAKGAYLLPPTNVMAIVQAKDL